VSEYTEPIFWRGPEGAFVPTGHARGPWDPDAQHGGAPAALLADAVQRLAPDMQVARLTYDFLGPVALAPLTVSAEIVRPGRRFQVAEGEIGADGQPAVRLRAVLLRRGEVRLPELALWPEGVPGGGPEAGRHVAFPSPPGGPQEGFHLTGMDIRFVDGSIAELGPAIGWYRLAHDLVEGEATAPIARLAAAADFGNGVSRVLDFDTHLFVNTDLSIHAIRDPEGEWVQLQATTRIDPHGVGLATSVLHDERGPLGYAHQTLFVAER
jgi:hypothetical protein